MATRESDLNVIQVITLQDYLRAVTSDGKSRRIGTSDLAQTIIENYEGLEIDDQPISVYGAIGSLVRSVRALNNGTDIDSDVLALYESLGWTPPNA